MSDKDGWPSFYISEIKATNEYRAIARAYGQNTADRSGIPLIRHIDEGLKLLRRLNADEITARAWCIHPLCQSDENLLTFNARDFHGQAVMLAMEYRAVANAYLSSSIMPKDGIKLSRLPQVNQMLIADKIQNRESFMQTFDHESNRLKSIRLKAYFSEWLEALGISIYNYYQLLAA